MDFTKDRLLNLLGTIAPSKYVQAVLIIILFVCAAKIIDIIINRIFKKWAQKTRLDVDDDFLDIIHRPVFISIILFGLGLATQRMAFKETIHFITIGSLKTIALVYWAFAAARFFRLVLNVLSNDRTRFKIVQDRTLPLFQNLLIIIVSVLSIYLMFLVWDIDLTAWIASAGIIGLAVSFAAKDTLANLFSGVFIMADAPYQLGDYIVLESGERGAVTNIGIRSTRMLTRDDIEITVPNSIMGNSKITNEAGGRHEKYRIRVQVGVSYGSDIDKVHDVLHNIAKNCPHVCTYPEPRVRFRAFGDSSLDHELLCWVERPVMRGKVLHLLNCEVYKQFQKENIEIPFPQQDVHIHKAEPEN